MAATLWRRWAYAAPVEVFLGEDAHAILGQLTERSDFPVEEAQKLAWLQQVELLKSLLAGFDGRGALYLEYAIPRLGKRIDAVPEGDSSDPTRIPDYYDPAFAMLKAAGIPAI